MFVSAFVDPQGKGKRIVGIVERAAFLVTGIGYAALAFGSLGLVLGRAGPGTDLDHLAASVLTPVFGMPTVKSEKDLDYLLEDKIPASKVECMAFHPLGSAKMSTTPEAGVVKPTGETWAVDNLFVCDGSVLPTSIGVNSQLPIMTVAMMLARGIADDWHRYASRA